MESRVKLFGHPLHQTLVVFPIGLLGTSVVFDAIHLYNGSGRASDVAFALISSGLVAGLLAAPWGLIDWLAIPSDTRAKSIGAVHGLGNVGVLLLFALSWWLRAPQPTAPPNLAWLLSFVGAGLTLFTGWLGGELVDRLGVGVSANANLNARSSLEGPAEPAAEPQRH